MRLITFFMLSAVQLCMANPSEKQSPDIESIKSVGNLGKLIVSIDSIYCWRDWMPIVQKTGPDQGSHLYIKIGLQFDNSSGEADTLKWDSSLFEVATREFHAVQLADKNNVTKWKGRIMESEEKKIELMSHTGPRLGIGGEVILVIRFENRNGHVLWLKSRRTKIDRTD